MISILIRHKHKLMESSISGSNVVINIHGLATALSVFNDLVRNPLQSFLKSYPGGKLGFTIDGLDESIVSSKDKGIYKQYNFNFTNLEGLNGIYFILTTKISKYIIKVSKSSTILDISSKTYLNSINTDVSSFIKLSLTKRLFLLIISNTIRKEYVNKLVNKVERKLSLCQIRHGCHYRR